MYTNNIIRKIRPVRNILTPYDRAGNTRIIIIQLGLNYYNYSNENIQRGRGKISSFSYGRSICFEWTVTDLADSQ